MGAHHVVRLGPLLALVASCGPAAAGSLTTLPTALPATVPAAQPASVDVGASPVVAGADRSSPQSGGGPEATDPPGIATLRPDGPWHRINGSPHVATAGLFYELIPGVVAYLPVVTDVARGVRWILGADDVAIVEAYLSARLVFYRSASVDPVEVDDPGWERWYAGSGGDWYRQLLNDRRSEGRYLDIDPELGHDVLLRPEVLGEERSTTHALVFDCVIDGSRFVDEGAPPPTRRRAPDVVGIAARLDLIDGGWRVSEIGSTELACLD